MALREIIDALDTYIESASGLEITCIKGYPDFGRPDITPPIAALFYAGSATGDSATVRRRVGAGTQQVVVTLGVYAAHEVQLFELAAKLQTIRKDRPIVTASTGEKVKIYVGDDERNPPDEAAPKEERHLITCPLVLSLEVSA